MSYLRSIPEPSTLFQIFQGHTAFARPLLELHDTLLRGPSPLSVAERELLAAYVSGLNACSYCHGIHTATAEAFGVDEGLLGDLLRNLDSATVDDRLRPLLRYCQKLTVTPSRMVPADAEAVYAVGWDEAALHDTVAICALFNFMNRYVEGLGISAPADYPQASAQRLHDIGYAGLWQEVEEATAQE